MADTVVDTDVLVVGGGIQGVTLLHQLTEAGARRVLLVSAGELGVGETLHSHGYMHHGYTMSAAGNAAAPLVRDLVEAAAWWRDRIRAPYAPGPAVYYALQADTAPERLDTWNRLGIGCQEVLDVPEALRCGEADREDVRLFAIQDRLVSMRDLLSDLADPLQPRIARARLTALELDETGTRVESCALSSPRGDFLVRPRAVLLACGREAQPLLRAARTPAGRRPLASRWDGWNRIRFVPMLLVRGTRLPQVCGVFEPQGLSLFTHPVGRDESMWIVTVLQGHRTDRGDFERSREEQPGAAVAAESVSRLTALVPEAIARVTEDLRLAFYFGGKIDHPDGGNARWVSDCGLSNLRLAWPGVWSLAWVNAREITSGLRESSDFAGIFDAAGAPHDLETLGLGAGVPVGQELRLTSELPWRAWPAWKKRQGIP